MNPKTTISLIIPCFNRLNLLKETVASVLAQTKDDWELILVDDGSNKETLEYLETLSNQDNRVKLFSRNREPKGAPTSRNIGAQNAQGTYLVFLDSDDLITPDFIDQRKRYIKKYPNKDFIVFETALFKENRIDSTLLWNTITKDKKDLKRFLDDDTPWHTSGPVWKKEAFLSIGGFNEFAQSGQDWEVHVKALIQGLSYQKIDHTLEKISHFMRDDEHESITSSFSGKKKLQNRYEMYREIVHLFATKKKLVKEMKNNIIQYFYRSAAMGMDLNIPEAVKNHILELNNADLASSFLCSLLLRRLKSSSNKMLIKFIDLVLFRVYRISNIDFPMDRTKGLITYQNLKSKKC